MRRFTGSCASVWVDYLKPESIQRRKHPASSALLLIRDRSLLQIDGKAVAGRALRQWDMLCSLVDKYGVVPKYAMPESKSSSATGEMNSALVCGGRIDQAYVVRQVQAHIFFKEI